MSADLWDCRCGAPGVKNLGVHGYCAEHLMELFGTFEPAAFELNGRWMQDGCMRPDIAPGWAECRCLACGATATAIVGTPCSFCEDTRIRLARWQAELLLRPELPDRADRRFEGAAKGWAERLARGVTSGLITEAQAHAAWSREVVARVAA